MRERPILFGAPMVRAILAGTKTQTRRVLKAEPPPGAQRVIRPFRDERLHWAATDPHDMEQGQLLLGEAPRCPYGQPGDRLWVREAWALIDANHKPSDLANATRIVYRADGLTVPKQRDAEIRAMFAEHNRVPDAGMKWKPSIHMPRIASRITLEITGVRVERLQDISEADAIAEGAQPLLVPPDGGSAPHVEGFRQLWQSINGEREPKHIRRRRSKGKPVHRVPHKHAGAASWDANPWVWVLEFRRV